MKRKLGNSSNNGKVSSYLAEDDAEQQQQQQEEKEAEWLIVQEMSHFTYNELVSLLLEIPVDLPRDVCQRFADFFVIEAVDHSDVEVVAASSTSGQHPLSSVLQDDDSTWWISAPQSFPNGIGQEWLQFTMHPSTQRRLSAVSIKIPPLPAGPLSVRAFQLQALCSDGSNNNNNNNNHALRDQQEQQQQWTEISPIWTVQNTTIWQRFQLNPARDVQQIRVVCLSNQMSRFWDRHANPNNNDNENDTNNNDNNPGNDNYNQQQQQQQQQGQPNGNNYHQEHQDQNNAPLPRVLQPPPVERFPFDSVGYFSIYFE